MWWNPINSIRHMLEEQKITKNNRIDTNHNSQGAQFFKTEKSADTLNDPEILCNKRITTKPRPQSWESTASDSHWKKWKFKCICGDQCAW